MIEFASIHYMEAVDYRTRLIDLEATARVISRFAGGEYTTPEASLDLMFERLTRLRDLERVQP